MKLQNTILAAAALGILAGAAGCKASASTQDGPSAAAAAGDKHACKGQNACKGQGGCKVEGKHECKGHNACKGQGGCKEG